MHYDVSILDKDTSYISKIIYEYFGCDILFSKKVGEGFYGSVYVVHITKDPYKVIVKWYKHSERNKREQNQLNLLRKHSLLRVPQVYFTHRYSQDIPYEALIMEFIEGVNASTLPSDHINREKFVEAMVGNLIHLHSISNDKGFGDSDENEMFMDWKSCLGKRVDNLHHILHTKFMDSISPYVMKVADQSIAMFDKIFAEPIEKSSLIHSDYNLWNVLVDEKTAKITAIIDPLDAGWADKEMDLFHLQNSDGDRFGLLDYYKNNARLTELFPVKNAFYWFWDDIKHMHNMGWYDEERFTEFGKKLSRLMDEYIY